MAPLIEEDFEFPPELEWKVSTSSSVSHNIDNTTANNANTNNGIRNHAMTLEEEGEDRSRNDRVVVIDYGRKNRAPYVQQQKEKEESNSGHFAGVPQPSLLATVPLLVEEDEEKKEESHQQTQHPSHEGVLKLPMRQLYGRTKEQKKLMRAYRMMRRKCRTRSSDSISSISSADMASSTSNVVVVSGPTGMGKSALVELTLKDRVLEQDHGFYVNWNMRACRGSSSGMDGLVAAFTSLALQISKSTYLEEIQHSLRQSLNHEEFLILLDMIPMMRMIIPQKEDGMRFQQENQQQQYDESYGNNEKERSRYRARSIFHRFFQCVSDPKKYPLVWVMNDCHSENYVGNACALLIVEEFVTSNNDDTDGILVILTRTETRGLQKLTSLNFNTTTIDAKGRSRGSIVSPGPSPATTASYTRIELLALSEEASNLIVADVLDVVDENVCGPLTHLLYWHCTKGNPFHLIELIQLLVNTSILNLKPSNESKKTYLKEDQNSWNCKELVSSLQKQMMDKKRLAAVANISEGDDDELDLAVLFKQQLRQHLDDEQHGMLSMAAFLLVGKESNHNIIDPFLLKKVLSSRFSSADVQNQLNQLKQNGLVLSSSSYYRFAHDGIQNAAYQLIEDDEREMIHLDILRKLLKGLNPKDLEKNSDYMDTIINQMKNCFRIITASHFASTALLSVGLEERELYACASICLQAAQQSVKKGSTLSAASEYLDFGIRLLESRDCWGDAYYDITLTLYNSSAEVLYSGGETGRVQERLNTILDNAQIPFEDKVQAYCTQINVYSSSFQNNEALNLGLDVMQRLLIGRGERDVPSDPRPHQALMAQYRMQHFMKPWSGSNIERLKRLPAMKDQTIASVLNIINVLMFGALIERPHIVPFLAYRAVRLTVEYGLCDGMSSMAFSFYGLVLASMGHVKEATQYGELSLELMEQSGARHWLPRVYSCVYGSIFPWTQDLRSCADQLQKAFEVGIEIGDTQYAQLCNIQRSIFLVHMGEPLAVAKESMKDFTRSAASVVALQQKQDCLLNRIHESMLSTVEALTEIDRAAAFDRVDQYERSMSPMVPTEGGDEDQLESFFLTKHLIPYKRMVLAVVYGDYKLAATHADTLTSFSQRPVTNINFINLLFWEGLARIADYSRRYGCSDVGKKKNQFTQSNKKRRVFRHIRSYIKKLEQFAVYNPQFCLGIVFLLKGEMAAASTSQNTSNITKAHNHYLNSMALFQRNRMWSKHAIASERAGRFLLRAAGGGSSRSDFSSSQQWNIVGKQYLKDAIESFEKWGVVGKAIELREEIKQYK